MTGNHNLAGLTAIAAVLIAGAFNASAEVPRPEHPRPDLFRDNWMTLNGEWQFEIDKAADGETRGLTYGKDLNAKIIVPFCPESKLSGLGVPTTVHMKNVWYRRTFELPAVHEGQAGENSLRRRGLPGLGLYQRPAWPDRMSARMSSSVSTSLSCLKDGTNEVVVKVLDDLWSGLQPGGKQSGSDQSAGCFYTRTTGIWQPVWLEAVGSSFVENISVVPDPDNARVLIEAKINGADKDLSLKAEAFAGGKLVGTDTATGPYQNRLVLNLKEKKLWEPGAPFLYDLKLRSTAARNRSTS